VDEVQPLSLLILSKCIQAYVAGLPGADQQEGDVEGPTSDRRGRCQPPDNGG
jgi:hypothetical protein